MAGTSSSSSAGGIGFVGALTIAFIVLRLTGVTDWSWWWVLSPALACAAAVVVILLALIGAAIYKPRKEESRS